MVAKPSFNVSQNISWQSDLDKQRVNKYSVTDMDYSAHTHKDT